jgi:hypothetical protein
MRARPRIKDKTSRTLRNSRRNLFTQKTIVLAHRVVGNRGVEPRSSKSGPSSNSSSRASGKVGEMRRFSSLSILSRNLMSTLRCAFGIASSL